jgi:hypothetical protein
MENATEVGNMCNAVNIPVSINSSILPLHIRNDMIACTLAHNRKDIFTKIVNRNESFMNELWDFLRMFSSHRETHEKISMIRWSRKHGGHPWDKCTMRYAAEHSNKIVIWLYNQHCPISNNVMDVMSLVAAEDDNLELLMWLREKGCSIRADVYQVNKKYAKTHKIGEWMEKQEKMGAFIKEHHYFSHYPHYCIYDDRLKMFFIDDNLMDFAI